MTLCCDTYCVDVTDSEGVKCSGSPDQGKCADYVVQWHYDADQRECQQFWFGGCHGNANRYGTLEDCESECVNAHAPNVGWIYVFFVRQCTVTLFTYRR